MSILILLMILGIIPAAIASRKNRQFFPWWVYGSVLFILALPHALFLRTRTESDTVTGKTKGNLIALAGAIAVVVVIAVAVNSGSKNAPQQVAQTADETDNAPASNSVIQPAADTAPQLPQAESRFIEIINQASASYEAGANDMAKGASRPRRAHALCSANLGRAATDWVGTVDSLSSTSDGKGVLVIRVSPHATLGTDNNGMSEALSGMHTLIDPDSNLFQVASGFHNGQMIRFSGQFGASPTDCFTENSLTQEGSMTDPEFMFQFTALSPQS